jgi:peptidyl-prolyl cis-trans isomerase D
MLDFLRRNARSTAVKVVLGIISLVFIFFIGGGGQLAGRPRAVAVVGETEISIEELEQAQQRNEQFYRQQYGAQLTPELLKMLDIPSLTLNQLVDAAVLRQEAESLGLQVPDEALRLEIREIPAFQRDGQFSPAAYRAVLERQGISAPRFEADLRTQLLIEQLVDVVRRGVHVTDAEALDAYHRDNDELTLEYVKLAAADYESEVSFDDAALAAWFDANAEQFREPERIRVRFVEYDPAKFADKSAIADEAIEEHYALHADTDYTVKETVSARHILKKVAPDADDATKKAARAAIDAVAARLANGEDFATVAKEQSEDSSAESGGDLGAFGRGRMVAPFEDAAFALEAGETSGVVESPFGFHIIQVYEKVPGRTKPLEEVRDDIATLLANEGAAAKAFDAAAADALAIREGGDMEKIAEAHGLSVKTSAPFARGETVAEVEAAPAFGDAAFTLGEVGATSDAVKAGDRYYVIQLAERIESRVPTLEEAREKATAAYRTVEARKIAEKSAEELLARLREATTPEAVAAALDGREMVESRGFNRRGGFIPGVGSLPGVKELGFATQADGEFLPRVFVLRDDAYIFRRKSFAAAATEDFEASKAELVARLRREREQAALDEFVRERKAGMNVAFNQELLEPLMKR